MSKTHEIPVFTAFNSHIDECGVPPGVTNSSPGVYVGYFQGSYGDQFVVRIDQKTGEGVLRGGDIGWDEECKVVNGIAPALNMSPPERLWLVACWVAATGEAPEVVSP
ncbi:MAG: hypothetical protein ABIK89_00280 [Planctomycetota bacterium]